MSWDQEKTKKKRISGPKGKVTSELSKETVVAPESPQGEGKEAKLNTVKVSSGKRVPKAHAHGQDAGYVWATQDDIGDQRVPRQYNLRNAGTPVSYARFFEEMDKEEW